MRHFVSNLLTNSVNNILCVHVSLTVNLSDIFKISRLTFYIHWDLHFPRFNICAFLLKFFHVSCVQLLKQVCLCGFSSSVNFHLLFIQWSCFGDYGCFSSKKIRFVGEMFYFCDAGRCNDILYYFIAWFVSWNELV